MDISIIVAMDKNNGIGKDNKLLWHIPKDFKWFKEKTLNQTILMGRKCYEDIITHTKGKPLPNRKNIILTRSKNFHHDGFEVVCSIDDFLNKYKNESKVFIVGGGEIYKIFLPYAQELIITHVNAEFDADIFFPEIDYQQYLKTFSLNENDENYDFTFSIYKKISA